MKRPLLSTQSMQRDLHRAACHLWAQKAHHQRESASSTCLAHVLWVVPRLAWPNHLRDWNEHHQSGMQDVPLKTSLFFCVLLSNWAITCGNSKTLNNSHPKLLRIRCKMATWNINTTPVTHSRHPAGRSPQTPAMERPPSATPDLNMVPATHPAQWQRNPHPFYRCSGTRIIWSHYASGK